MSDADAKRCRLIARFEKEDFDHFPRRISMAYPTCLDDTMRAARRLPAQKYRFELAIQDKNSWATLIDDVGHTVAYYWDNNSDPAFAAFVALSDYLAKESANAAR